jgi:hypothetical protein
MLTLKQELIAYLDSISITSENIGDIRQSLMLPWTSEWNATIRDETAARENKDKKFPHPFDHHVKTCQQCQEHPMKLCDRGMRLLEKSIFAGLRPQ